MSGLSRTAIDALENQAFGLMGRLHVILRREIGRVTDIKYMSGNAEYCRLVLDLAAHVANPDLQAISKKLEEIYFGSNGLFEEVRPKIANLKPAKVTLAPATRMPVHIEPTITLTELAVDAESVESEEISNTYVGRLR